MHGSLASFAIKALQEQWPCVESVHTRDSPVPGSFAAQRVDAHSGALTPPPARAQERCTPSYLSLLQCVLSSHSSRWHVSKLSVRPATPKRHKTLQKVRLHTRTGGLWHDDTTVARVWVFLAVNRRKGPASSCNPSRFYRVSSRFSIEAQLFPTYFLGCLMCNIQEPSLST